MIGIDAIHHGHILIVDDQTANINALSGLLAANGYQRISATTDARAVPAMHKVNSYDLILLDLHMPDISGLEVMEELRAADPEDYLPVIVVTGDQHSRIAALEAGARDFIVVLEGKSVTIARVILSLRGQAGTARQLFQCFQ